MKNKLKDAFGPVLDSGIMTTMVDWKQNLDWIRVSRTLALDIKDYLHTNKVGTDDFAKAIGVDVHILNEMLRGRYNFTIKEIADIKRIIQ